MSLRIVSYLIYIDEVSNKKRGRKTIQKKMQEIKKNGSNNYKDSKYINGRNNIRTRNKDDT
jgi:hypothetical protein